MTVPVCWLNLNPEADARGSWDSQILERICADTTFYRHVEYERLHVGAVYVIAGQHNSGPRAASMIADVIGLSEWALTIITQDEEALFPIELLPRDEHHQVWVQYHARAGADRVIPIGSGPDGRYGVDEPRSHDVWFIGQATHTRREELLDVMRECWPHRGHATNGFRAGLSRQLYLDNLAITKLAPCPSGIASLDSFRLYEALEAGCIPIVETHTPNGNESEFWPTLFGDHPLPVVDDWHELSDLAPKLLADFDNLSREIQLWWRTWQVNFRMDVEDTIKKLRG